MQPAITPGGSDPSPRSRWFHYAALTTLLLASTLVFVGGAVTSRDAGMAFPDAPLSNGALINPPGWLSGVKTLWEHSHRLIGWVVGMLAVATVISGFILERRRWVRLAAIGGLFAIVVQGLLGIFRVKLNSQELAMIHGIWGPLTFSWLTCVALFSSGGWRYKLPVLELEAAGPLRRSSRWVVAALLIQLGLGAATRHHGSLASLIIHIWWGVTAAVLIGRLVLQVLGEVIGVSWTRRAAMVLGGLTVLQLLLGLAAFAATGGSSAHVLSPTPLQWLLPTLHVLNGALVVASAAAVCALCHRTLRPASAARPEGLAAPSPA